MTVVSSDASSQWLRGVLDLCLMAVVADEPAYGYEMTRRMSERGLAVVAEGSIYPALGRLERDGLLAGRREPGAGGPPRKYYRLTSRGRTALAAGERDWSDFVRGVSGVLNRSEGEK